MSRLKEMDDRDYAQLASMAYHPEEAAGYSIDVELSDRRATVFHKNGRAVIAYRGTADSSDLADDLNIAFHANPTQKRLNEAYDLARRTGEKYNNNVTVTGHSLGGTVANNVSDQYGYHGTVFNPGSTPLFDSRAASNIKVVRNPNDLVSTGFKHSAINITKPNRVSALLKSFGGLYGIGASQYLDHSMRQFIP